MFIVTVDNPYHPKIYYCEHIEDAQRIKAEIVANMTYDAKVCIAQVWEIQEIKTDY